MTGSIWSAVAKSRFIGTATPLWIDPKRRRRNATAGALQIFARSLPLPVLTSSAYASFQDVPPHEVFNVCSSASLIFFRSSGS
jgi:hypothetical protein